jgi:hypothetical protein
MAVRILNRNFAVDEYNENLIGIPILEIVFVEGSTEYPRNFIAC